MATQFNNDAEEERVLRQIEKALRLADDHRTDEKTAAVALATAQRLADAFNIDIAGMRNGEAAGGIGKAAPRDDSVFPGGLYPYQRKLYEHIALLNHCLYWNRKGLQRGEKYKHRLVGSKVNVLMAKQMGEYLQSTVERLAREYAGHPSRYFTRDTHAFREGVVDRVIDKIRAKRHEDMQEAKRRKAEEQARANHPGAATSNALVLIDDVVQREEEANYDFQYGEGAWAKKKAKEAQWAADLAARIEAQRKAQEEYAEWERNNPEEAAQRRAEEAARAAAQAEEDRKYWEKEAKRQARNAARRKGVTRYRETREDKVQSRQGYWDGQSAGSKVSLDRQVEGGAKGYLK
jgi:hypothetical protein